MARESPAANIGFNSGANGAAGVGTFVHSDGSQASSRRRFWTLWLPALVGFVLLAIEIYALVYDLGGAPWQVQGQREAVATLLEGKRDVWDRAAGTVSWTSAKTGETYYREDAIATMADSEASVQFTDGSSVHIEPNSLVVLERSPEPGSLMGKISVRLLRGGLVRRKATKTPLEVSFQGPEGMTAQTVKVEDASGDSVVAIRAGGHGEGVQVQVDAGSVRVNDSTLLKKDEGAVVRAPGVPIEAVPKENLPPLKLKAPKINKPAIKRDSSSMRVPSRSLWAGVIQLLAGSVAQAASTKVTVDLSWEIVFGAKAYRLQISDQRDFSHLMFEKDLADPEYRYLIDDPENASELYYRVAAIDQAGLCGEFSEAEKIDIPPPVELRPSNLKEGPRVVEKPRSPKPKPLEPVHKVAETAPAKVETAIEPPIIHKYGWQVLVAAGAVYHSRKLKDTQARPAETSGSGFVPGKLDVNVRNEIETGRAYVFGFSALNESIKPAETSVETKKVSASIYTLRVGIGNRVRRLRWDFGPYLSNSTKLKFDSVEVKPSRVLLLGVSAGIGRDMMSGVWGWDLRLAGLYGLSSSGAGADFSFAAKLPVKYLGLYSRDSDRGLYVAPEVFGRVLARETGFGGGVDIGYAL